MKRAIVMLFVLTMGAPLAAQWIELPGGGGKEPLFAQSDKDFVFPTLGGLIEFVTGPQGTVTHMLLKIVEGEQRAVRVNDAAGR